MLIKCIYLYSDSNYSKHLNLNIMLLWIIGLIVFAYFYDLINIEKVKQMPIWHGRYARTHRQKQALKQSKSFYNAR
jgi:hypothetical protein